MNGGSTTHEQARIGRLYVILGALREGMEWAFWLGLLIWWVDELALSPFQLVLMGVTLSVTVLLTETPTGVVADMYSRKWSMVIGMLVMASAYAWAVSSRSFWLLLPGQVLFGLGWTFTSGADIAWLTDELRAAGASGETDTENVTTNDNTDHLIERLLLRRHRLGMTIGAAGVIFMMFVGRNHLIVSVLCTAAATLAVGIAWALFAPEENFNRSLERATFRSTLQAGAANVRSRPRLQTLVVVALLTSLAAEALDRFGYVRFIQAIGADDESIVVTGALFLVMATAGLVMNIAVSRHIDRRDRTLDATSGRNPMVLPAILLISAAGIGALLTASGVGVAVIGLGMMVQDSTRETLFEVMNAWTNREVESSARATVHSLIGQALAVGEIIGGLLLGLVAELVGIRTSLVVSGCLLFVAASVALPALQARQDHVVPHNKR